MKHISYCTYMQAQDARLYTLVALPEKEGKFPIVLCRSPYVDAEQNMSDEELCAQILRNQAAWLDKGYAVVSQHCRGRGKSEGDCVPYIYEREDGLALQHWAREQSFYNGELYLWGSSYTSSVHLVTAPFAEDIKAAFINVQDSDRYNCNYRNGFYKMGLHGSWFVGMYKHKSMPKKPYVDECYNMLPLIDFSQAVFGEKVEAFDEILLHPRREDPFWLTRLGGGEARDALSHANIPILLVTGFYDIYTGGIFDMWNAMDEQTRSQSVLLVQPYAHSGIAKEQPIAFENGELGEAFGNHSLRWMEYVRGKGESPWELGKVTYYNLFGNAWRCDDMQTPETYIDLPIGEGEHTYRYNPYAPASFKGGLSANFGGTAWQDAPNSRYDILSFYTPEFDEDLFVKGKMRAKLRVKSSCEDTCFYMRLSLAKEQGDYGLRDDIQAISNFDENYVPGTETEIDFVFDEHAFTIHKGEKLRVDISSSAFPWYVRHTNNRGPFALQTTAKVADNTVLCDSSYLRIYFEKD